MELIFKILLPYIKLLVIGLFIFVTITLDLSHIMRYIYGLKIENISILNFFLYMEFTSMLILWVPEKQYQSLKKQISKNG